jgi:hypothetical protein
VDALWGVLGALATLVLPMALAGWLLGRPSRRRARPPPAPHGKMTGKEQG